MRAETLFAIAIGSGLAAGCGGSARGAPDAPGQRDADRPSPLDADLQFDDTDAAIDAGSSLRVAIEAGECPQGTACVAVPNPDDSGFCGSSACTPSFCPPGPSFLNNTSYFEWTSPVPLRAGHSYRISFVSSGAALLGSAHVSAWASGGHCSVGEKFMTESDVSSDGGTWQFDECVTPDADYSRVTLDFAWGATSGATGDIGLQVCDGCGP